MGRAATELRFTLRGKFHAVFGWSPKDVKLQLDPTCRTALNLTFWCRTSTTMDLQIWRVTGHEIQSRLRFWVKKDVLFGGRECSYTQAGCLFSDHQILKLQDSRWMNFGRYGLTEAGFDSSSGSGFQRVSHTLARSRLCEAERWDPWPITQVFALCVDVFLMGFMTCHQGKLVSNDVGKCLWTCTASATACTHVRYTSVNLLGSSEDSVPSNHEWSKALLSSWPRIVLQALFYILKAIRPVKVQSIRTSHRLSQCYEFEYCIYI